MKTFLWNGYYSKGTRSSAPAPLLLTRNCGRLGPATLPRAQLPAAQDGRGSLVSRALQACLWAAAAPALPPRRAAVAKAYAHKPRAGWLVARREGRLVG